MKRLQHFLSGEDFVRIVRALFAFAELRQPRALPHNPVVKALGVAVPVVLSGPVQAVHRHGYVDEFQQRDMFLAVPAQLFHHPVEGLIRLFEEVLAVTNRSLVLIANHMFMAFRFSRLGQAYIAHRPYALFKLLCQMPLADMKRNQRVIDSMNAVYMHLHALTSLCLSSSL